MNTFKEKVLDEAAINLLHDRIEPILDKIIDEEKKEAVKEFWYKHFFNYISALSQIDLLIESGEVAPEDVYDEIACINERIMANGDKLEEYINNKRLTKEMKNIFRDISGYWVYKSNIVKHAYEKPFGYAGDYEIIEIIYNNVPQSSGIGYCYDKYFLENEYARSVRSRKDKIKEILCDFLSESHSDVEIFNLACGPTREITELLSEDRINKKKITFSLLDHDINALNYSKKNLNNYHTNINYRFINDNVLNYINKSKKDRTSFNRIDFIYCLGLFDYLPERIMKQIIVFLYDLLKPGCKLIIAHKDSKMHKPLAANYWCDWIFYPRDEKFLINIVNNSGINNYSLKITRDSTTRIIIFLIIEKDI